jgi:hypothetical protein
MRDGDYGSDPSAGDLADVARSGAREWQRDMAAWESDAEQLRLRQRTLVGALWEAMQRGDQVTITLGKHTFAGVLVAARGDLAILTTGGVTLALNIKAIDVAHFEVGRGGTVGDRTFGSLRAYAGMLEVEGPVVRILGDHVDVRGRVVVVAEDHLLIDSTEGAHWAVAWGAIAAIAREDQRGVSS